MVLREGTEGVYEGTGTADSDLGVEDLGDGLGALGAERRGELHGQTGALDGHDRRGGVGCGAVGERGLGVGGLWLLVG